jgi:hypothetical protein
MQIERLVALCALGFVLTWDADGQNPGAPQQSSPPSAPAPPAPTFPVGRSCPVSEKDVPITCTCTASTGVKSILVIQGYSCYTTTGTKCGGPYYPPCFVACGGIPPAGQTIVCK